MTAPLGQYLVRPPRYGIGAAATAFRSDLPMYIRITDIDESGRFRPDPIVSVDSPLSGNYQLRDGDIVVARTGASVGKSYRYRRSDGDLVFAGFLIAVRPDSKRLDPRYLGYTFQSKRYWDWIASESMRSGQPGINAQQLAGLEIDAPDIETQREVADKLEDVDNLIESLERLIAKKRGIKQGMMQALLSGHIRIGNRARAWRTVRLLDLVTIVSGQVDPRRPEFRDLPLIAPDHLESGTGRLLVVKTAAEQGAISGKYLAEPGDVIYSKIRPYLQKAHVAKFRTLCSADMYPLRPKSGVDPEFILNILLGAGFTDFAVSVSMRSGIPKINREELAAFDLAAPSSEEQQKIAEVLLDADAETAALERRLESARAVKTGMMQELLTGNSRLPVEAVS